ncbi:MULTISPECIES: SPFH domain-containing protein [unclassified Streptomyces]|uniref:SPFH domain-containing protein n=1 Tax=unclassified Streptomyces TaxID=2593676 RepID=UPI003689660B
MPPKTDGAEPSPSAGAERTPRPTETDEARTPAPAEGATADPAPSKASGFSEDSGRSRAHSAPVATSPGTPTGSQPPGPTASATRPDPAAVNGAPGLATSDARPTGSVTAQDTGPAPADRPGAGPPSSATRPDPAAVNGAPGPTASDARPTGPGSAQDTGPASAGRPAGSAPASRPGGVQGATASRVAGRGVERGPEARPAEDRATAPAAAEVPVFKPEYELPDLGPITIAGVGTATPRPVRRKNVIGTETTGSIPVHLLFRDASGPATASSVPVDDDGGPDTVAMAPPTGTAGFRVRRPDPAAPPGDRRGKGAEEERVRTPAARPAARPAPTADPDLVERPASVLPGWLGIAGGALALAACAAVVWWTGVVPGELERMLRLPHRPYHGIHLGQWALLALGVVLTLFAFGGLGRGRVGYAWVLTLFGDYRGTVRRTGLVWISPLLLRRRVDVRLRHWRSEPLPAVDAKGTALDVVVLVVWRVRDTVRAALGVDGHEEYLREQVEAAMARVLSQLPADAFHEDAPTLRDAEAVGEALTRMLSAECAPVGLDVFSAQPTRIEYAPEVAAAMRRRRIAAIDAKHRDSVLTSVVDAVDDVVHRLTSRGLVELDDYERKALVKDLTVAFYTGRTGPGEGA